MTRIYAALGVLVCLLMLTLAARDGRSDEAAFGSVSGRVASADSGYGLRNASVILLDLQTAVHTDQDALFRFDQVPPGSHTLRIRSPGFQMRERVVNVTAGENSLGTIALACLLGWATHARRKGTWVAMILALLAASVVARTAHLGGQLVYVHGAGRVQGAPGVAGQTPGGD